MVSGGNGTIDIWSNGGLGGGGMGKGAKWGPSIKILVVLTTLILGVRAPHTVPKIRSRGGLKICTIWDS